MITLTYSRLRTLAADDTVLNEVEQTGSAVLTGALNSMTERKRLYMEFAVDEEYDEGDTQLLLPGSNIHVNFSLWLPIGFVYTEPPGPPLTGFNFIIPDDIMGSDSEMFFYSNGSINPTTCKNFRCWFKLLELNTFSIEFEFYNTYDENTYLNAVTKNNEYRFLSEYWNELNYNEISASVYQQSKQIRAMVYIVHEDGLYSEKHEKTIYEGQSQSYNAATTFKIYDTEDDLTVISSVIETSVTATIASSDNFYDEFYAKLIRIRNDGTLDFVDNYDLQENHIDAANITYNVFKGPFAFSYSEVTDKYTLTFIIDPEFIEPGAQYRIIIMGYGEDGSENPVARFGVSNVIQSSANVPYCDAPCEDTEEDPVGLYFTGKLFDIDNEYGNELTCSIEERIRSTLEVDYSDDRWSANLECRGWLLQFSGELNDIRHYLKHVQFQIYTEYADATLGGTVKNLLVAEVMSRVAANTYTSQYIDFSFDTVGEKLNLSFDFRCRNEINQPALITYLNGLFYPITQDTQYWGAKDLFIKWRLVFEYHDVAVPFIDNIDFIQKLHVKDYSPSNILFIGNESTICSNEIVCYQAHAPLVVDPPTYKLINTIEKMPINGALEESENFTPDIMDKEESDFFDSQVTNYGEDAKALFCIDSSQMTVGETYKITAMAKKQK